MKKCLLSLLLILAVPFAAIAVEPEVVAEPIEVTADVASTDVTAAESDATVGESSEPAPANGDGMPWWGYALGSFIILIVTTLGGFLKKKWGADETKSKLDSNKSLLEQKNFLIDNRLIPFAISTAEHWLLTQSMTIIKDATDGGGFQWKDHFDNLRGYVKTRVIKKFAAENIDIIEQLGERELDNLLDRIVTKLITKLPDSIQAFLPDSVVEMLTSKASEFLVDKGKDLLGVD